MRDRRTSDDRRMGSDLDARFDAELARAARRLVTEELPRGVLDTGLSLVGGAAGSVRARRAVPSYAGFAAVAILLVAAAVALVPGGIATPSATPPSIASPTSPPPTSTSGAGASPGTTIHGTFRTTAQIRGDFTSLGHTCVVGSDLLPTGPSPSAMIKEGAVCTAPADAGPFMEAVIVGEARDGRVVQVHAKADLTGEDTTASREAVAAAMAKAVAIAVAGQGTGNTLGAWVVAALPMLAPGSADSTQQLGFAVKIFRSDSGGYQVVVFPI